jgi:hypothetical protein
MQSLTIGLLWLVQPQEESATFCPAIDGFKAPVIIQHVHFFSGNISPEQPEHIYELIYLRILRFFLPHQRLDHLRRWLFIIPILRTPKHKNAFPNCFFIPAKYFAGN